MKKKLLIFGIPVIVLIVVILLVIGRSPSPSDLADSFESAIKNGNAEGLIDLVTVDDDVEWDKKHAKSIIKYLQDDEL